MIGHMLTMYVLKDRNTNYKSNEIEVMVTADRWEYARGRDIEFLAVGLPDKFAFVVEEQRNTTPDALIRSGDCRQGSWVGLASRTGTNKYQAVEATGVENQAGGLVALGTSTRFDLGTVQDRQQTARVALGEKINYALALAYSSGMQSTITQNQKLALSPYSYSMEQPPNYYYANTFGEVLDTQTRTVRTSPSEVRRATYERTGEILTTAFSSYGEGKLGGLTYLGKGAARTNISNTDKTRFISNPMTGDGMAEAELGGKPSVTWVAWTIAGGVPGTTNAHFLSLTINTNGTFSWNYNGNWNPSATGQGDVRGWNGFVMFSDDKADTADTPENRQLLIDTYNASKARETVYKINYPIYVPIRFAAMTNNAADGFYISNLWTTEADFINHNYTIGGK